MAKYKVGDIVKTSSDAQDWGTDKIINNRTLKITEVGTDKHTRYGCTYEFEDPSGEGRFLRTRECEILGMATEIITDYLIY